METTLTKHQVKTLGPLIYKEGGETYRITATVRYDDQCGNGHNTFSITSTIDQQVGNRWRDDAGGYIPDAIAKHFPELAPFIKWHLTSSDGPMHYIANTVFHAKARKLDAARRCAVWPDATDDDLTAPGLAERLTARLPALLADFRKAVESLGFVF